MMTWSMLILCRRYYAAACLQLGAQQLIGGDAPSYNQVLDARPLLQRPACSSGNPVF